MRTIRIMLGVALWLAMTARAAEPTLPVESISDKAEVVELQVSARPRFTAEHIKEYEEANAIPDSDPPGTVRLIGTETDIGRRYKNLAPAIPIPPFSRWHQWLKDHEVSVHCSLEWKDNRGNWFNAEMRSSKWEGGTKANRVGMGQFPTTGYFAYGVYIYPGRYPRKIDIIGRPVVITLDEVIQCDYRVLEAEIRKYGAYGADPRRTHGDGSENCGLGGPAYKPGQNSNTMVNYVLRKSGVQREAPDRAIGWDTEPFFPHSTNNRYPKYDNAL